MKARPARPVRKQPQRPPQRDAMEVPEVVTERPRTPPAPEPDDETIRRMLEAAYT